MSSEQDAVERMKAADKLLSGYERAQMGESDILVLKKHVHQIQTALSEGAELLEASQQERLEAIDDLQGAAQKAHRLEQENERLRESAGKLDLLRLADWVENVRGTEDDWEWPKDIRGLHAALEEGTQDE